ncbi:protocadherin Fat 4 [Elysia marginata]|uniref:Protocadherin Fat 4 n=1 Tax=Elysia marginata TaxID=1093978 RepID=A0AAV4FCQ8_9GAST|nr:protocadherin Fat 4 [Elysia marginata]
MFRVTSPSAECLEYRAGVDTLSHASADSYLITVACEDSSETPATEVIQVIITPSSPPVFDPDVKFASVNIDVNISSAGDVLYDVNATDADFDDVIYTLAVTPAEASDAFFIGPYSGEITALYDLIYLCLSSVSLEVTITDGVSTPQPLVITMLLDNSHVSPIGINLDREVHIPEDATGTVYTIRFVDGDGDALTYSVTSSDTTSFAQYSVTGDQIDAATALDYEDITLRTTDLTIKAADPYCESQEYSLRLEVTDVNEAPTIFPNQTVTNVKVCEGLGVFDPGLTVNDPDLTDVHVWTLISTNLDGYYSIDPSTGWLGTTLDYDIDPDYNKSGAFPTNYLYVVQVGGSRSSF